MKIVVSLFPAIISFSLPQITLPFAAIQTPFTTGERPSLSFSLSPSLFIISILTPFHYHRYHHHHLKP
jgi:hypothetical protein